MSIHRYGEGFYPGTGHPSEVGTGAGLGTSVNIAFTGTGYGDREYLAAFHRVVMPISREFGPDLVLVAAGFDAALGDPLGGMALTPAGFAQMTAQLQTLANGKVVVAVEGGYDLRSLSRAAAASLRTLLGEPAMAIQRGAAMAQAIADIEYAARVLVPHWKSLQLPQPQRALSSKKAMRRELKLMRAQRHRGPWWYKYL